MPLDHLELEAAEAHALMCLTTFVEPALVCRVPNCNSTVPRHYLTFSHGNLALVRSTARKHTLATEYAATTSATTATAATAATNSMQEANYSCDTDPTVVVSAVKTPAKRPRNAWDALRRGQQQQQQEEKKSRSRNPGGGGSGSMFTSDPSRPCPFYKWIPDTALTVDAFRYGMISGCQAYLLSHFHADHYGGLTRAFAGTVYCSAITSRLVVQQLRLPAKQVVALPMETPVQVMAGVTVTLLEANHCPGAVLFLVNTPTGKTHLHTGDFRATPQMADHVNQLLAEVGGASSTSRISSSKEDNNPREVMGEGGGGGGRAGFTARRQGVGRVAALDTLFLDTTYCDERYAFPTQERVIAFCVQRALAFASAHPRGLVFVGAYTIGKERVWLAVAEALGARVWVEPARLRVLKCLEWPRIDALLTKDRAAARVHVVSMRSVSLRALREEVRKNLSGGASTGCGSGSRGGFAAASRHILAFRPTGWAHANGGRPPRRDTNIKNSINSSKKNGSNGGGGGVVSSSSSGNCLQLLKPARSGNLQVYAVPYSEHSSVTELRHFVRTLRPKRIVPTVGNGSSKERARMQTLFRQWQQQRR